MGCIQNHWSLTKQSRTDSTHHDTGLNAMMIRPMRGNASRGNRMPEIQKNGVLSVFSRLPKSLEIALNGDNMTDHASQNTNISAITNGS